MLNGDRLRELRLQMGFTHQELAARLELNIRQIARYESGETSPSGDVLIRMSRVFEVSTDYLLGITSDPLPNIDTSDLLPKEREALFAWRRGQKLEAVKLIVNDD